MSGRLVLDASAGLHAVLPGPAAAEALDALAEAAVVVAPDLYCFEVANALWKYVRSRRVTLERGVTVYERALSLVDRLVGADELAKEALALAAVASQRVYEMSYAVLARREGAAVLTADRAFAAALRREKIGVHLLSAAG